jgi:hypothetical protein
VAAIHPSYGLKRQSPERLFLFAQNVIELHEPVAVIERQPEQGEHGKAKDTGQAEFLVFGLIVQVESNQTQVFLLVMSELQHSFVRLKNILHFARDAADV